MFGTKTTLESFKQLKISKTIQKKLIILFQKDFRNLVTNNLTSVTSVKVSPDIKTITIYFSFLFDIKAKESFLIIENNKDLIKRKLYNAIKNDLQTMPELIFKIDSSQAEASRLERLYQQIQNDI